MFQIWACETEFVKGYIERVINASPADVQAANEIFHAAEQPEILAASGKEATITIKGLLSQSGPSPIDRFFGYEGTSYAGIIRSIEAIRADRNIETVRLLLDTPGGEVKGVDQVWTAVYNLAQEKTVISENLGLMASAGYWIGSPSDRIVADSPTALTGSIGVVITYIDTSKFEERIGIKFVEVVSKNAPNKRPDLSTKDGLKVVQERADALERIFIKRIAQGRGVTDKKVAQDFGRGAVLLAADPDASAPTAVSVGLIDSVRADSPAPTLQDQEQAATAQEEDTTDGGELKKDEKKQGATLSHPDQGIKTEKEIRKMDDLIKLMAENPALKTQHQELVDKAIADAVAGPEAKLQTLEENVAACVPYLVGSAYPEPVQKLACDVLQGNAEKAALLGAVTVIDSQKETDNTAQAAEESTQAGETPGQQAGEEPRADGEIHNENDYQAQRARFRALRG